MTYRIGGMLRTLSVIVVLAVVVLFVGGAVFGWGLKPADLWPNSLNVATAATEEQPAAEPTGTDQEEIAALRAENARLRAGETLPAATPGLTQVPPMTAAEMTTAWAKQELEINVQRLAQEPAAWVWRAVPEASDTSVCPVDWICTLHTAAGPIQVFVGDGIQREIVAGTFRYVPGYPGTDAVRRSCDLLAKEVAFGGGEVPSFSVTAGNFRC